MTDRHRIPCSAGIVISSTYLDDNDVASSSTFSRRAAYRRLWLCALACVGLVAVVGTLFP